MKQPTNGRLLSSALALLVVATLAAVPANAAVINFGSDLLSETNNINGTNQFITPHPAWSPNSPLGSWISFAPTGVGGVVLPNSAIPGPPTAIFTEFLPLGTNWFSGIFWADDTASVTLFDATNPGGLLLKAANPLQDGACAAGPIGCEPIEGWVSGIIPVNPNGAAWIEIGAYQRGLVTFGAKYEGQANVVPEPASFLLLGSALLLVGASRKFARR